jgi:hypothetical protein
MTDPKGEISLTYSSLFVFNDSKQQNRLIYQSIVQRRSSDSVKKIWNENQIPRASRTETRLSICGMWTNNKSTQQINKWIDSTRSGGFFNNFPESKYQRISISYFDCMHVSYLNRKKRWWECTTRHKKEFPTEGKNFFTLWFFLSFFCPFKGDFLENILLETTVFMSFIFHGQSLTTQSNSRINEKRKYSWGLSRLKSVS